MHAHELIRSDFSSLRTIDLAVGTWIYYSAMDIKKLQLHAAYNLVMYLGPRTSTRRVKSLSARCFCMDRTCHLYHPAWQQSRSKLIIIFLSFSLVLSFNRTHTAYFLILELICTNPHCTFPFDFYAFYFTCASTSRMRICEIDCSF